MGILIKPLVSEKMTDLSEEGKYAFVVDKKANKVEIKKEVEKLYGVSVTSVNTAVIPGKPKTRYTKTRVLAGNSPSYKKAIVSLADGEIIDFYSEI